MFNVIGTIDVGLESKNDDGIIVLSSSDEDEDQKDDDDYYYDVEPQASQYSRKQSPIIRFTPEP